MKNIKFLLLSIFVILITAGCSKNSSSDLVGTWYNESVYDYVNNSGWYYCEHLVFGDDSTYYSDVDDVGRYAFTDNHIYYLSGWNEGWELNVENLSKNKLEIKNTDREFHSDDNDIVTFSRFPEIKNFEEFIQGQWGSKDNNGDIDQIFEVINDLFYVSNDAFPINFINNNILFIRDDYMIFIEKINNNEIILYRDGCIHESEAITFYRMD